MKVCVMFVMLFCILGASGMGDVPTKNKNRGKGSMWWGIAKAGEPNNLSPLSPGVLYLDHMDSTVHSILRRKQRRLSRENPGLLSAIAKGVNMAVHECQYQFRNHRWNCSTRNFLKGKNLFGKIVDKGCRETAFIYSITSAAVSHAIARACSDGSIDTCNCEAHHKQPRVFATAANGGTIMNLQSQEPPVKDFEWGGCSDNIGFGIEVSREFVDTGERGKSLREKINLHNNEAGRWHVQQQMRQECKCHGMSGSCTVKTCWKRLPSFRVIGDLLKDRYDGASHVTSSNGGSNRNNKARTNRLPKHPKINSIMSNSIHSKRDNRRRQHKYSFQLKSFNPDHKPPTVEDLVYYEISPGFCEKNPKYGIQGTHGRHCNHSSGAIDECGIMCCGRGFRVQEVVVVERCNCTFHWCCEVKCDTCRTRKTVNICV